MANVGRRIERLEGTIQGRACICAAIPPVAIVVVKKDWTSEQVDAAKEAQVIVCPAHGRRMPPIMTLSGSDVHG
jgi:hypothetical protein